MPPLCLPVALIGLLYPCIDRRLGEPHKFKREWSSVMRCVAVFVGINHASAVSFRSPDRRPLQDCDWLQHFCFQSDWMTVIAQLRKQPVSSWSLTPPHQKVDFANNVQLSLTLAALSIGLWWSFDRSRSGFGLGVTIALLATLATQILVYNGVFQ